MNKSRVINILYFLLGHYITSGGISKDEFDEITKAVSLVIRILNEQEDWA